MLVSTGRPPEAVPGEATQQTVMTVAQYLGSDLLRQILGGSDLESGESVFDRFDFEAGRNVSSSGEETWEARFRVAEGIFGTRDSLFLTGDRDQFDHYNGGLRLVFRGGKAKGNGKPREEKEDEAEPPATNGRLVLRGNEAVSNDTLRSALEAEIARLFEGEELPAARVDDLASEAERYYRERGHHFVRIDYETEPGRAILEIDEGPRVLVDDVRFVGNEAISDEKLEDLLDASRTGILGFGPRIFVERQIRRLAASVGGAYLERGFQEVHVGEPRTSFSRSRRKADITITIDEGPRYVVRHIDASTVPRLDPETLANRFASLPGTAYVERVRLEIKGIVDELYAEAGYPNAEVEVTQTLYRPPDAPRRVDVDFSVRADPGPLVRVRDIVVVGDDQVSKRFVESRILLEPGDRYDSRAKRRSLLRLFRTGLFLTADVRLGPPDPEEPGRRDLIVEVSEKPTVEYFVEPGWGSYDRFRLRLGVRERNLFGRGLVGRAEVLGSLKGGQVTVGATDPWFFESEWTADAAVTYLRRREPSYDIEEANVTSLFSRRWTDTIRAGATYRFSLSEVTNSEAEEFLDDQSTVRVGAAGPFIEYDTRNDLFAPTEGLRARLFGELGASVLGGEISFVRGGFTAGAYAEILEGTVLAGTVQTEWIAPIFDTDTIPIQERLFNGGENGVRSFQQSEVGPKAPNGDPLGGEVRNLVSLELRQRLVGNLEAALFGDYGNVALTTSDAFRDFRPGIGAGLRYGLPIGPVRLDYAWNPAHREGEDSYAIHLAIGMPF
jgi:outer membrane protein assembly complex protein YaeT